ncbi:MAG: N-acetyltransferase [Sphingobacteriales bacterium]|nr:MAG: N-acetyltransferase [Sphingobacteriales bacterium]
MIRLERFEQKDFGQLIEWINTEELLINWAGSLFSFPLTNSSMEWYVRDTNHLEKSDAFVYRVVEEETGETVGHISLGGISRKNRSARISRVLIGSNENKGKGYCKQMIRAVIKIGFEDLKLHRISLGVYDFNTSALRCYQSAGFTIEGTMKDVLLHKGKWWSLVEMAIMEDEWRALSEN